VRVIEARQKELDDALAEFFGTPRSAESAAPPAAPLNLDDQQVIEIAAREAGERFTRLFDDGDLSANKGDQSAADFALICQLLYFSGGDTAQTERLFSRSALGQRDKWSDRPDYRERTVAAALAAIDGEFYDPAQPSSFIEGREPDSPAKYADITLSNQFINQRGDDLRFVKELGEGVWFIYFEAQSRWVEDRKMSVWTLIKRFLAAVASEAYTAILEGTNDKKKATEVARVLSSASKVAAIHNLSRSHPRVAATMDIFNRDPWRLNTPGGVVNLKDGTIGPARREDFFTKITPVAPRRMPTPLFDQFVLDIMGMRLPPDFCRCCACVLSEGKPLAKRLAAHRQEVNELADYLMRLYGYCLSGDVSEHVLAIEIGDGGNGKGVLNNLLREEILGVYPVGYTCEIPIEALLDRGKSERHPTELMDLWGSRLALARESDENTRWNEGRVKTLSGDDPIKARRMRQDFVEFPPTHKLIIFGQAKPRLYGADQAAWKRRLHLIPFSQKYDDPADEARHVLLADKELKDKLRAEAPGILEKLIRAGLQRIAMKGLKPPPTVRAESAEYLVSQNILTEWLDKFCVRDPNAATAVEILWTSFESWGRASRRYVGYRYEFNGRLEKLGFRIKRTKKVRSLCQGIGFKLADEQELLGEAATAAAAKDVTASSQRKSRKF